MILSKQPHDGFQLAELMNTSHTAREIGSQPKLWKDTYEAVSLQEKAIQGFLGRILPINNLRIILTGAGTSAFIGEILQHPFYRNTGVTTMAISTTDIVTHPGVFFQRNIPTLLVSFARSGDSPESVATFALAEKLLDNVFHLVITCNPEGKLAQISSASRKSFLFILPEEANDQALAMTSSFTSMTLAGLLISDIQHIRQNEQYVDKLVRYGKCILEDYADRLSRVAELDFKKTVFLGSGLLKGSARESHLKMIELTDGHVFSQYDSFLGFRHGPKAIIDEFTVMVYLFSRDKYVSNYEVDLVRANSATEHIMYSIGVSQFTPHPEMTGLDLVIVLGDSQDTIPDEYFAICSVIPSQILGLYKSLAVGLSPDSPSKSGGIHRVVQGVTIYPY